MGKLVNVKVSPETRDIIREAKSEGQTYDDLLKDRCQTSDRLNKSSSSGGREEGIVYLSTSGTSFEAEPFNIQTLTRMVENPYIAMKLNLNNVLYFPSALKVEARNPEDKIDEDVTNDMKNMVGVVGCIVSEKIKQAKYDTDCYGISLFNPVWEVVNGVDTLVSIRHLPAWSFSRAPSGYNKTYSHLLPGVTINPKSGEVEYWQIQEDGEPIQINNIMTVKNPRDEGLAGDSKLAPLYDFINMAKFGWNVELQAIARAGAPIFFLKITKPKKATDPGTGGVSDISLGNKILSSWSTSKQHLLRENMEVVGLPMNQKINVIEAIERIEAVIDNYFSVTNEIKSDGNRIGGSDLSELKLLNRAIQGAHSWLIPPFEALCNEYFVRNGFPEGWHVKLSYDVWESDDREVRIQQVLAGLQGDAVDLADIREKLDFDPADEEKLKSIAEYNKTRYSYKSSGIQTENSVSTTSGDGTPDAKASDANRKKVKGTNSGSGAILNKLPVQGNNDLDELGQKLYNDITGDFEKMIDRLSKVLSK